MNVTFWEILLVVLVILLLFGGKKIPELMKGLGKGVKSFKDGMKEVETEVNSDDTVKTTAQPQAKEQETETAQTKDQK